MAPHSSTLAWKIPWMEEPGRLPSMGSHRVDWSDLAAAAAAAERGWKWNGEWLLMGMFFLRGEIKLTYLYNFVNMLKFIVLYTLKEWIFVMWIYYRKNGSNGFWISQRKLYTSHLAMQDPFCYSPSSYVLFPSLNEPLFLSTRACFPLVCICIQNMHILHMFVSWAVTIMCHTMSVLHECWVKEQTFFSQKTQYALIFMS